MKPSFVFVLLVLAFVSSQAHTVSKGNSSLRGKIGKEGSDLLKNRVLKKAKGSKHGKENKTSSSTSGGGDSNRVLGIKVPTWPMSTVISELTIELVIVLWGPVIKMAILRSLYQVSKVWI